jgi:hypothetical protein
MKMYEMLNETCLDGDELQRGRRYSGLFKILQPNLLLGPEGIADLMRDSNQNLRRVSQTKQPVTNIEDTHRYIHSA